MSTGPRSNLLTNEYDRIMNRNFDRKFGSSFSSRRRARGTRLNNMCTGGYWVTCRSKAIDSGSTVPIVTQNEDHVHNVDENGGMLIMTSTGDTGQADGSGTTRVQTLAVDKRKNRFININFGTGKGGSQLIKKATQDLLGSYWL